MSIISDQIKLHTIQFSSTKLFLPYICWFGPSCLCLCLSDLDRDRRLFSSSSTLFTCSNWRNERRVGILHNYWNQFIHSLICIRISSQWELSRGRIKPCIDICLSATALIRVSNTRVIPSYARVSTQHQHDTFWSRVIIVDLIITL